jgi:hypothetical protein
MPEKIFWEIPNELKEKFSDLEDFNKFLEKDAYFYADIYRSCLKAISDFWEKVDTSEYEELDFQIKYLIEETKVPINKILGFVKSKYLGKVLHITSLMLKLEPKIEEILRSIVKIWKWKIVFTSLYKNANNTTIERKYWFDFDLNNEDSLNKLECDFIMTQKKIIDEGFIDISLSIFPFNPRLH